MAHPKCERGATGTPLILFTAWQLAVDRRTENRTGLGYLRIGLVRRLFVAWRLDGFSSRSTRVIARNPSIAVERIAEEALCLLLKAIVK
jgi:hypothetical protein